MPHPQDKVCEFGKFSFHIHNNSILVYGDEREDIEVAPAEVDKFSTLLNTIGGMIKFNSLPAKIVDLPFIVEFTSKGECLITRDKETRGIRLIMSEVDVIIRGVRMVTDKIKDINRIRGGPEPGVSSFNIPDPIIEGR